MRRPMLALLTLSALLHGQSEATQFVSFPTFINAVYTASSATYLSRQGGRVKDLAAFEDMRRHVLTMYQGVSVSHSFVLGSHYFDCVPIEQQPSVRLQGLGTIATPPSNSG